MSIASSGHLIDALRETGLLNRSQLGELPFLAEGRCGEARALAKVLVQRGWLTVYQANQLLVDKARELVIGPYHVLDRLGQGGLSCVYKARQAEHGWLVALKLLNPEVIASSEGRRQFLLEIEAMARLDHPNIVQFCDADQVGETVYYAMEFIEGTDLGKYVRLCGSLPVAEACDYIRQAALGLQHAHERNLVHRDIKPMNLYITEAGRRPAPVDPYRSPPTPAKPKAPGRRVVKILDWGLASLCNPRDCSTGEAVENLARGLVGTADYLSPEQARDARAVDIRADIYSLGCTFYYLLTGQAPFPDGTLMQKLLQHQNAEPAPLSHFRADVPDEVNLILRRMLAKQPDQRFRNPAGLALALLPFTRADGKPVRRRAGPDAGEPPAPVPRSTGVSDPTPLPMPLGGIPGLAPARLARAGKVRRPEPGADTSSPH